VSTVVLEVDRVSKRFGGLRAVDQATFSVQANEILGLIGPNGAGKTTLFNLITGMLQADSGQLRFLGQDIRSLRPDQRCKLGIARTFQITKPFVKLSLLENVLVGAQFGSTTRRSAAEAEAHARRLLDRVGLGRRQAALAATLSVGDRKRLELARALATEPSLLLLDEVLGGLNTGETRSIMEIIREIRLQGVTIILIEHVMHAVMSVSDRIIVLHNGVIIAGGTPQEVVTDQAVIDAYLGGSLRATG